MFAEHTKPIGVYRQSYMAYILAIGIMGFLGLLLILDTLLLLLFRNGFLSEVVIKYSWVLLCLYPLAAFLMLCPPFIRGYPNGELRIYDERFQYTVKGRTRSYLWSEVTEYYRYTATLPVLERVVYRSGFRLKDKGVVAIDSTFERIAMLDQMLSTLVLSKLPPVFIDQIDHGGSIMVASLTVNLAGLCEDTSESTKHMFLWADIETLECGKEGYRLVYKQDDNLDTITIYWREGPNVVLLPALLKYFSPNASQIKGVVEIPKATPPKT
ncbi:MAG: DUF6585 family protein [Chloroflexota bacterium]